MSIGAHMSCKVAREDGVAMFYALLVVLVVSGIVAVMFASAFSEERESAFELAFEDTIHVAEAGAEEVLQRLAASPGFTNTSSDPDTFGGTESEWAIEVASDTVAYPDADITDIGEGEAVGLRPSAGNSEFVYGVGFVPSRAAYLAGHPQAYARVVKMQLAFTSGVTPGLYTMLAGERLELNGGGGSGVFGSLANLHTNGTLVPPNSGGFTVDGAVTSLEPCEACAGDEDLNYEQIDTPVPINFGTTEEMYATDAATNYVGDGGNWYDYCSGVWKERVDAGADPCDGPDVDMTEPFAFSGTSQIAAGDGVYYFAGDEAPSLASGEHTMTIITGGQLNLGGRAYTRWTPAYPGLLVHAGGPITTSGNMKINTGPKHTAEPGTIYSATDIEFNGNPTSYQVAWIAERRITLNGGGAKLYNLDGDASTDGGAESEAFKVGWQELG